MAPKHTTRRTAWWLFGLVSCVYLATHQGPTAGDDVVHYESGRALVLGQQMALSPQRFDLKSYPSLKIFARQGLSGDLYMTMAPGLSVVTAPLCAVGLGRAAALMAWNAHRFGSPWDTGGYHQSLKRLLRFDSLPEAMAFNLLSFNQGLLFFNPPLLVAIAGLGALWRRQRSLMVAIVGAGVVSWVFYSAFVFWNVTVGWGPRFLMPMVPLLLLPLATLGQGTQSSLNIGARKASVALTIATAVGVLFSIIAASSPLDNETIMALMGSRQDSLWVQALESEVFLKARKLGLGHIELGWASAQQAPWMVVLLSLGALGCAWKMKESLQQ